MRSPGPEHNPPTPATPIPERSQTGGEALLPQGSRIPRALISLPCVRWPLMGIPLPLLSPLRGLAGEREKEEDFFFFGGEKKPDGVPGSWAECPSAPVRSGLGISSGIHRHEFPCPPLKKFPGFASCYSQQLVWLKFCHLDFFIWTQRYFQASLVIYPSIHSFIHPSNYPSIHPSTHLSRHSSIEASIHPL